MLRLSFHFLAFLFIAILDSCDDSISYDATINEKLDASFDNAIISAFLIKRARANYFKDGYYEYMKPWYETIRKAQLPAIIIHDGLPKDFIIQYQTDKIRFVYAPGKQKFEPFEQRFLFIDTFLSNNNQLEQILITDINHGGIYVKQDPFVFMKKAYENAPPNIPPLKELLFISEESAVIRKSNFWSERLNKPQYKKYQSFFKTHKNAKSLCICFWGGDRGTIQTFLAQLTSLFTATAGGESASGEDMLAFNYLIYKYYLKKVVTLYLGPPESIQLRNPPVAFSWCERNNNSLPTTLCEDSANCADAGTERQKCNIPFGRK